MAYHGFIPQEYKEQVSVSPIVAKKWLHFAVVVNRGAPCSTQDEPTSTVCSQIEALLGARGVGGLGGCWVMGELPSGKLT